MVPFHPARSTLSSPLDIHPRNFSALALAPSSDSTGIFSPAPLSSLPCCGLRVPPCPGRRMLAVLADIIIAHDEVFYLHE